MTLDNDYDLSPEQVEVIQCGLAKADIDCRRGDRRAAINCINEIFANIGLRRYANTVLATPLAEVKLPERMLNALASSKFRAVTIEAALSIDPAALSDTPWFGTGQVAEFYRLLCNYLLARCLRMESEIIVLGQDIQNCRI